MGTAHETHLTLRDVSAGSAWWLTNVRVETRVSADRSETRPLALRITDGVVAEFADAPSGDLPHVDGGGHLLLPGLRDMHIHLDKTYYGGPWQAPTPWPGVPGRIAEEARLLPELAAHLEERANETLDLLVSRGTTHVRAHCNVDHIVGASSVARLADVLRDWSDRISWDIVAFPQHGMRGGEIAPLMEEALQRGATMVGGLDPAGAEQDVNGVLDTLFDLAVRHDADIDIHLHDAGELGVYELERIADRSNETGWQGRVTVSHAYALAQVSTERAAGAADRLAEAGVAIATTVPFGETIPIPLLAAAGVDVSVGTDSVMDHWNPFGTGDMLEKVSVLAERFGWFDEWHLASALRFATGAAGASTDDGGHDWPSPGADATFMLVDASCSAEAVARRSARRLVVFRGRETLSS